jgi:hypothetical protein
VAAVIDRLSEQPGPVVLCLDTYEVLGLAEAWLRQVFVPALPDKVRVILAGRLPPTAAWTEAPEWQGLFRALPLGPLSDGDAARILARCGVDDVAARRIIRFACGHPLALILAGSATASAMASVHDNEPMDAAVDRLAQRFLGEVEDAELREGLRAACVVRRITLPLLRALAPGAAVESLFGRLADLAFVSGGRDGLVVHDAVREAVAADLQASAPDLYRRYRLAAWRALSAEARAAPASELWRYTADLIYLLGNPVIREAFFPRHVARFAVEPARPEHGAAIEDIARAHDPDAAQYLVELWARAPDAFHIARAGAAVAGFYCLLEPDRLPSGVLDNDPLLRRWRTDLAEHPLASGQTALFIRRWLGRESGERPSPVQAACWLDIKRHYMERRPRLRRVYLALQDATPFAAAARSLGIDLLGDSVAIGASRYSTGVLDMGPGSVDGWLSRLVAAELGVPPGGLLDHAKRALCFGGRTVPLTCREFDVMAYLSTREGVAVSRDDLIANVWRLKYDAGSNVVDAVVASLRRKLAEFAPAIETVRGYGYVYRTPPREARSANG